MTVQLVTPKLPNKRKEATTIIRCLGVVGKTEILQKTELVQLDETAHELPGHDALTRQVLTKCMPTQSLRHPDETAHNSHLTH